VLVREETTDPSKDASEFTEC